MQRFDQNGMMVFPSPDRIKKVGKLADLLVIKQCYCPDGHNLVSDQAVFDGFNGIVIKVRKAGQDGLVALNPVYGLKHRVSIGFNLVKDDLLEVLCPVCEAALPAYTSCSCGGNLVTLFLDERPDYTNSILICNRVDCHNAQIRLHNEIVNYDDLGHVIFK